MADTIRLTKNAQKIIDDYAGRHHTTKTGGLEQLLEIVQSNILVIVDDDEDYGVRELQFLSENFTNMQKHLKKAAIEENDEASKKSIAASFKLLCNLQNSLFLIGAKLENDKNGGKN